MNGKTWSLSEMLVRIVMLGIMLLALQVLAPLRAAAGGANVFVIGIDTGTTAALVSSSAGTFYGIDVTSGTTGAIVKCFNLAATTGVSTAREANLLAAVVISSGTSGLQPLANFQQQGVPAVAAARNASTGIACVKSVAGDLVSIIWGP